jgi:hypothetical protein
VTSAPNRTSPVTRGAWILENLLGSAAAAAAAERAGVPEKKTGQGVAEEAVSVRDKMIQHRTNQPCLGCHQIMDPIGLALENFDGVGRWRTAESGVRIDASGKARRRHAGRRRGEPPDGAAELPGRVRPDDDREAADVRGRPRRAPLRHAGRARITREPRAATIDSRRWCWRS